MWTRFLRDMHYLRDASDPYFFGVLITKQRQSPSIEEATDGEFTLIDGQQRLTTFIIFFKVLSLLKKDDVYFDRFRLERGNKFLALIHNRQNRASFERIANLGKIERFEKKECDSDRILAVYEFFVQHLQDKKEIESIDPWKIYSEIKWIVVNLASGQDEQQIFDTINSLGVRLTTAELLKNYFFDEDSEKDYSKHWESVFEKDDDTVEYWDREIGTGRSCRPLIETFFYAYLQIKVREKSLNAKKKIENSDRTKYFRADKLFLSYKDFIEKYDLDRTEVVREIGEYAKTFRQYFDPDVVNHELPQSLGSERVCGIIFGVGQPTLIPYVLFLLKQLQDEGKRNGMFKCLEIYVMRRIIAQAPDKHYNNLFGDTLISEAISTPEGFWTFMRDQKGEMYLPSDSQIKNGFRESRLTNQQARGVLYFIESKIRNSKKQSTRLLGIRKFSLEHLMPKKWENHWGKLQGEKAEARNAAVASLGNLAILAYSLNKSLRDRAWHEKLNGFGKSKGLKQYASGIETIQDALDHDSWDEKAIADRANRLCQHALEIWKIG